MKLLPTNATIPNRGSRSPIALLPLSSAKAARSFKPLQSSLRLRAHLAVTRVKTKKNRTIPCLQIEDPWQKPLATHQRSDWSHDSGHSVAYKRQRLQWKAKLAAFQQLPLRKCRRSFANKCRFLKTIPCLLFGSATLGKHREPRSHQGCCLCAAISFIHVLAARFAPGSLKTLQKATLCLSACSH